MKAWDVILKNSVIDTVFYLEKSEGGAITTADEVREALINHDGYNPGICVVAAPMTEKQNFQDTVAREVCKDVADIWRAKYAQLKAERDEAVTLLDDLAHHFMSYNKFDDFREHVHSDTDPNDRVREFLDSIGV